MKPHSRILNTLVYLSLVISLILGSSCSGTPGTYDDAIKEYQAGHFEKARELLTPLAEQGDAKAQSSLGSLYDKGEGVPYDTKEAVKWFRKAAEQGDPDAQNNLATIYASTAGFTDYKEAAKWYRVAAEQGHTMAQFYLGNMYASGMGMPQDNVQMFKWLTLAIKHFPSALGLRDGLEEELEMTPDQITEAKKLAAEWKPKTWEELSKSLNK